MIGVLFKECTSASMAYTVWKTWKAKADDRKLSRTSIAYIFQEWGEGNLALLLTSKEVRSITDKFKRR